jgi:hypothetical protein
MLSPFGIMEVARMNGKPVVKKNNLIFFQISGRQLSKTGRQLLLEALILLY